ncbi:polyprenyl synthetase family protein [Gilvimarinus sp. SDUM040013]|uniref:Farnesyl diphosphate synthase n=1 Tax=Gilvimarinus gilvus TaxID=3058038 RepID=A0ABU4RUF8_9GAMM|nr:farnesyl diphosphate synthase [Gilvimarinus sp. SDUM040013]MDO3386771.1 polyprenyl synthetase family protein [Gilvimarinus sp. SDUM040013]MDX6848299.1 farnesyl diphosphate synthase [Gilvimarinus sp. SDUM040013]
MSAYMDFSQSVRSRIDSALQQAIPDTADNPLGAAMRYALAGGGKRIRPLLVFAGFQAVSCKSDHPALDNVACAIEAIHAYSLIHDDLPAMDDDDLRRGQPTCHIAFDEATAILAGDALQTLAFELLAKAPELSDSTRLALIQTLARGAGAQGMVLGQAIDLAAVDQELTLSQLEHMHRCKTGALIDASITMGAWVGAANSESLSVLTEFSRALGLAFQVQDDILDVTSDTQTLGKQQGADQARNKPTYVSLLGLDGARQKAQDLYRQALDCLPHLPGNTQTLRVIAQYIVERKH